MKKDDLMNIVGKEYVSDEPGVLSGYGSDHSFTTPKDPSLVVKPASVDEIQKIVQLANRLGDKLVPVSSGGPRFRGDTVPAVEGATVVDLSRMNEIMWMSRRNRVVLVQPGLTFGELEPALEKEGLRAMMPLAPKPAKSVIGAWMEREPFTVPKYSWDNGDPVASSEFVLGDGNILVTGAAAGPGTLEQQREVGGAQKSPLGTYSMDARRIAQGSQGNIGICTWMSLRCELLPEHERIYFVGADKLEDLLNFLYRSLYLRLIDEQYIMNALNFATLFANDPEDIDNLRKRLPNWVLVTSIGGYGDGAEEQFKWKDGDLRDEAEKMGVELLTETGGISESFYRQKVLRKVSEEPYRKLRYKGDVRELMFLTTADRTPEFIPVVSKGMKKGKVSPDDIGVYIQMVVQGKMCHCEFDIYSKPGDVAGLKPAYTETARELFGMGAFFSRPYDVLSDIVYGHDGYKTFNKYARSLKDIFDPNHVLNPEKLMFRGM